MSSFHTSLIINILVILLTILLTTIFLWKLKIDSKNYKLFFAAYIFFWIPIMLLRPYSGSVQKLISSDYLWLALVLAGYGFVGIFARPMADFVALKFNNRKIILYLAAFISIGFYLPFIIRQTNATSLIQSFGIGIGASVIGTYELMFKEQYGKNKSFLTVTILAIPPLIADFISSPIQSIIKTFISKKNEKHHSIELYSILWIIAITILLLFIVMIYFVKENRNLVGMQYGNKIIEKKNHNIFIFIGIIMVGMIILFIKFSNSASIATMQLQIYEKWSEINLSAAEGYLSTIFTFFQLIGTFFIGYFFTKGVDKIKIFFIGIFFWVIYHLIGSFVANPIAYMIIHSLNGFSYGILYNLLLGFVLSYSFNKNKLVTPMGIYQSFLSIGITASSFFTQLIKSFYPNNIKILSINELLKPTFIINFSIIGLLSLISIIFLLINYFEKNKFNIKE
ncbi:MAG: MFS transporter [Mycoplasmoidaceae bacterium]